MSLQQLKETVVKKSFLTNFNINLHNSFLENCKKTKQVNL